MTGGDEAGQALEMSSISTRHGVLSARDQRTRNRYRGTYASSNSFISIDPTCIHS
jgi:hypothetical protein